MKALGHVERQIGSYYALQQLLATAHIHYAVADDMTGHAVPAAQLLHAGQPGLVRDGGGIDPIIDFTRGNHHALRPGAYHWQGMLLAPTAGRYFISLQLLGAGGAFSIDGQQIGATESLFLHGTVLQPGQSNVLPTTDGLDNVRREVQLSAGAHTLSIQTYPDSSGEPMQVRLAWLTPAQQRADRAAAVATARTAQVAIVFAWSQGNPVFALPADQDRLIEDIDAAIPATLVVLNVSEPIAMPWLTSVAAVLQLWYPGDEGGWATADLLTGQWNPAGRLPFTWPHAAPLSDELADDGDAARSSAERERQNRLQRGHLHRLSLV